MWEEHRRNSTFRWAFVFFSSLLVQVQGSLCEIGNKKYLSHRCETMTSMYEKPLKLHHKFHPSLGFASSVLQNVGWYWQAGKPVFKTVFYFFGISVALLFSTGFLAQFTHDKMNCSRSTCTWLNVKNHPWIRNNYQADQNYHISHLFSYGICDFCTCFIAKPPGSSSLANIWWTFFCDFSFHATSIKQRVTDQSCSLRLGNHMKPPRG